MVQHSTNGSYSTSEVVAGIGNFAAAAVLWVSGVLTVLSGISVLSANKLIIAVPDYVYGFNATAWGWIHIILGVLAAAVALGLFWGTTWARLSAVIIASLSIVSMFMWLPQYPVWSIVLIALDIFVIWAVATWQSPRERASRTEVKDVMDGLAAQPQPTLHPLFGGQPIRPEDGMKDGRYEVTGRTAWHRPGQGRRSQHPRRSVDDQGPSRREELKPGPAEVRIQVNPGSDRPEWI